MTQHALIVHYSYFAVPIKEKGAPFSACDLSVSRKTAPNMKFESPINVPTQGTVQADVRYAPTPTEGRNVTLDVEYHPDGFNYHLSVLGGTYIGDIEVNGIRYDFDHLHLHSPSENMLDGEKFPLEMHLAHKVANNICVLGIFFRESQEVNVELEKILGALELKEREGEKDVTFSMSILDLVGDAHRRTNLLKFTGSLTTPPYTLGIQWVISKAVQNASEDQIKRFRALKGVRVPNNRPIKDAHKRPIFSYFKRDGQLSTDGLL